MNFTIDREPPTDEELLGEREHINKESRRIRNQDTVITMALILVTSIVIGVAVYWSTGNIKFAAGAFSVFPVIGVIMGAAGLITVVGFRSNALREIELKNDLVALSPVSDENLEDLRELCGKYPQVQDYYQQVTDMGRDLVNGELAMFWEWDASTQAKTARQRAYLENVRAAEEDSSSQISTA